MSELRFDAIKMQAALVGRSNPHPQFSASTAANLISTDRVDPQIPLEDYEYINYARRNTCLPYLWQDAYERNRTEQSFKTAVLENETLKAVFLLEYGGRLWSLFHKPTQRELLYVNPIFQPGNLAIRGAWFSGGIEWNFGLRGHTPFTCDPVFVATSRLDDGTPVLRIYEYERVTCLPFQLDFYLPDKSELLFVRVTIRNPDSRTVPIYWWSNIAVPETQDCRVLVPADSLYSFAYGSGKLVKLAHPYLDNTDRSRPTNLLRSSDSFYVIPTGRQPWIASVDKSGNGLFQASTKELRGRKLFAWGQSSGGKNWQQFLSLPNQSYIEIQAGLDRTQSTCQPLHGFDRREWIETYGLITCDPEIVHGANWSDAWQHAEQFIHKNSPMAFLEHELARTASMAESRPSEVIQNGSGWGALEEQRRCKMGEKTLASPALPFPETTFTDEQAQWVRLLEDGILPMPSDFSVNSYMDQEVWQNMLDRAIENGTSTHWYAWLQRGVMHIAKNEMVQAFAAFEKSLDCCPNAWAARNLAQFCASDPAKHRQAIEYYKQARSMRPDDWQLAIEYGQFLINAGFAQECLDELELFPDSAKKRGRFKLIEARAALTANLLDRFELIAAQPFKVEDIREGDVALSDLWFKYKAKRISEETGEPLSDAMLLRVKKEFTPPEHFDFRM